MVTAPARSTGPTVGGADDPPFPPRTDMPRTGNRHPLARPPKESLARLVAGDLRRHPGATAKEISGRTGLGIGSVNWELRRYAVGHHEEPRYCEDGFEKRDGHSRPAQTWRLYAEPKGVALRRLNRLMTRVREIVATHPEFAGAAIKDIQTAARKGGK